MMAVVALAPHRFAKEPRRIDAAWYRRSRRFAELPVSRVAYAERGRGPAALFVHGYPLNGFQWRGALERLHAHRRCIAPDLMGMGFTQTPEGQTISPATQATMLAMLLDALHIGAVDLVANDSGGAVAQLFLAKYPRRVRTLLLTSCDVDEKTVEAALRAQIPYLDVAAEIEVVAATFEQYADRARQAGIVIVPAMAFYGGLGDLLATAAMWDWPAADEICIAYGLSSWKPTLGTRATTQVSKQRRDGRRIVFSNRRMEFRTDDAPILDWTFPAPVGKQAVVGEFTMADSVTIPSHLSTPEIRSYMTVAAVKDLSDPDLSPPAAADESGRSSQTFLVEVVARSGSAERRAAASGRDIYAITAPLVVEATERVVSGRANKTGVVAAGEAFDARDFLRSLSPEHLSLEIQ